MTRGPLLLILTGILAGAGLIAAEAKLSVARWPGNRTAAVSLTFDDGIRTHLDVAGPILKKHRIPGTFFVVTGGTMWRERLADWRKLAAEGHELANHTVHHPCLFDNITPRAQDYTPSMMQAEVRDAARAIVDATGTRRGVTCAYPCGSLSFGKPADHPRNAALYLGYMADSCFAARSYTGSGAQNPDQINVMNVLDLPRTWGRSFVELLDMLPPVVREHEWGIYSFHGVGGQHLSITADALDELAGYLARHSEIWTTTFGDGVRYTQAVIRP